MTRPYQLKRRAASQIRTRQRIVEAAIELHQTIGPAATTVSEIAERADVGRVTVYRHFPDETSLSRACSGLYFERHPVPEPERWRQIADPEQRLRTGLHETYAYHRARIFARRPLPLLFGLLPARARALARRLFRRKAGASRDACAPKPS